MRFNSKVILLISIMTGFVGFSLTFNALNGIKKAPEEVMVASVTRDLNFGDTVTREDIQMVPAPKGTDLNDSIQDQNKAIGQIIRNALHKGDILSAYDLINEKDNINGLIPQGYRASTIPLSLPQETLDSLKFGSRVDILFADTSEKLFEAKTIMKNVLVMRVFSSGQGGIGGGSSQAYVTMAVKPDAVETLTYAIQKGKVDLSVRPLSDRSVKEEYMTLDELLGLNRSVMPTVYNSEIEIIRGIKKETVKL